LAAYFHQKNKKHSPLPKNPKSPQKQKKKQKPVEKIRYFI
jgi:hypothetical protein